ncbi:unnamed protein product [Strongylus vulgaris]|uniref:Uncharacterized protein n=1 Tax=Strongylus vulgaris TaxID=40348 RepID=A0A3P7J6R1_STRVU|nr:unnamed protein product [Strongylus vulgaris]
MRAFIFFLVVGVVFADYQSQNSGYENAEIAQPTPGAPLSADGGDQQAYNSDVGSDGGLPLVPSQPPASGPTLLSPYTTPVVIAELLLKAQKLSKILMDNYIGKSSEQPSKFREYLG